MHANSSEMLDRNIPPQISDFAQLKLPPIKRRKLTNGAELVVIADGTQPVAQLTMNWTGGFAEAPNVAVPRLVAAGLREGSATASADELEELLDFNGAQLRTSAQVHYMNVSVSAMTSRLEEVLPTVLDAVYHPTFPDDRIDRVRQRIVAVRAVELERVETLAAEEVLRRLAGPDHYLSHFLEPDEVMTLDTGRMLQWHGRVFNPVTMTAYLSGNITPELEDRVVRILEAELPRVDVKQANVLKLNSTPTGEPIFVEKPGAQQCAVNISIPTIDRRHPDYARLRLAIYALGGYFGSRLMTNIREERGLTYGINALLYGYREGGVLEITAATSPGSVDELISETMAELARIVTSPLGGDEMQRVRRGYFTRLAATLDTPFGISDFVQSSQLNDSPENYFDLHVNAVRDATPQMIAQMFERHIDPSQAIIAVAGVRG